MPFVLKVEKRVREPVRVMLAHLIAQANKMFSTPEDVVVRARAAGYVVADDWSRCDGIFNYPEPDEEQYTPHISLACNDQMTLPRISHAAWHEIRHAKQWYEGGYRAVKEDGIDRDAEVHHRDFMASMKPHWPKEGK